MKAVVADFNQVKTLVGAFSVIRNLRMEVFEAPVTTQLHSSPQLVIFVLTCSDRVMTLASGMWKVVTILALQLTTDTGLGKKGKYADNLGGGFCVL